MSIAPASVVMLRAGREAHAAVQTCAHALVQVDGNPRVAQRPVAAVAARPQPVHRRGRHLVDEFHRGHGHVQIAGPVAREIVPLARALVRVRDACVRRSPPRGAGDEAAREAARGCGRSKKALREVKTRRVRRPCRSRLPSVWARIWRVPLEPQPRK